MLRSFDFKKARRGSFLEAGGVSLSTSMKQIAPSVSFRMGVVKVYYEPVL